jgi:hypothetical protein
MRAEPHMVAALTDLQVVVQLLDIVQLAARWALDPHIIGDLLTIFARGRRKVLWLAAKPLFHLDLLEYNAALLYHTAARSQEPGGSVVQTSDSWLLTADSYFYTLDRKQ